MTHVFEDNLNEVWHEAVVRELGAFGVKELNMAVIGLRRGIGQAGSGRRLLLNDWRGLGDVGRVAIAVAAAVEGGYGGTCAVPALGTFRGLKGAGEKGRGDTPVIGVYAAGIVGVGVAVIYVAFGGDEAAGFRRVGVGTEACVGEGGAGGAGGDGKRVEGLAGVGPARASWKRGDERPGGG